MRILITGANGFVGKHLIQELERKNYKIRCLVRKPVPELRSFELVYGDISKEEGLKGVCKDVDCVIHLAALKRGDINEMYDVNVKGTENLLKNCRNVKQFIYISTALIDAFESSYTKTKKEGEEAVKKYVKNYTILRLPHMYAQGEGFLNSKTFIFLYKKIKGITGARFNRGPDDVANVCRSIANAVLNKKYYKKSVVL